MLWDRRAFNDWFYKADKPTAEAAAQWQWETARDMVRAAQKEADTQFKSALACTVAKDEAVALASKTLQKIQPMVDENQRLRRSLDHAVAECLRLEKKLAGVQFKAPPSVLTATAPKSVPPKRECKICGAARVELTPAGYRCFSCGTRWAGT